ncbi:MAG: hypothetical protein BAJALOKI1v1_480008 [Promethearchaeota archaeon]|nr:MAG: hypothetical protein BAJALOKI1v1_480008 [Candidatus Lokiarchaeota archaeon]
MKKTTKRPPYRTKNRRNKTRTLSIFILISLSLLTLYNLSINAKLSPQKSFYFPIAFNKPQNIEIYSANWSYNTELTFVNASFIGEKSGDNLGQSLIGLGDINSDGYNDFALGAPNALGGKGVVYIFLGDDNLEWSKNLNVSNANASFIGENTGDFAGYSIAAGGDITGNEYDDFIIGAYGYNASNGFEGKTYLIEGKGSGWTKNMSLSTAKGSFIGENTNDNSGFCISGVGDVNGDNYNDFIIGAYGHNVSDGFEGKSYLIRGKRTGWINNNNLTNAGAFFIGESSYDLSGMVLSGVGDVNSDNLDDILIGAPNNSEHGLSTGQVYLILGDANIWGNTYNLSSVDASFYGEFMGDSLGDAMDGLGNVNNDNYDDFIIGARLNSDGASGAGKSYLFFGSSSGWSMDTNCSNANISFIGTNTNEESGSSLAGIGDINADGKDDFLIGAPNNSEGANNRGKTYLFFGSDFNGISTINLTEANASYIGENAYDLSGSSIAGAGDLNGDNSTDFFIGAYNNSEGGNGAGKVYLCFGIAELQFATIPNNITYNYGKTGNNLTWVVIDDNVKNPNYTVYIDNTPYTGHINRTWTTGENLTVNVDNLNPNEYNFTLVVSDGLGHQIQNKRKVTVTNEAPSFSVSPSDISFDYVVGVPRNYYLVWNITDDDVLNPNYTVYLDGSPVSGHTNNSWTPNNNITVNVTILLSIGSHNFTIIAEDGLNITIQDVVLITVINEAPNFTEKPQDTLEGVWLFQQDITLRWNFTDSNIQNQTYTLYINGKPLESYINQTWTSGESISLNVNQFLPGKYNITLIVEDGLGQTSQHEVLLQINIPTIINPDQLGGFKINIGIFLALLISFVALSLILLYTWKKSQTR